MSRQQDERETLSLAWASATLKTIPRDTPFPRPHRLIAPPPGDKAFKSMSLWACSYSSPHIPSLSSVRKAVSTEDFHLDICSRPNSVPVFLILKNHTAQRFF